ncbi:putative transcription factor GRF family [Medicago truncatula]|uniref:Putative transcription factor GRF family n=1 Tax=Medicago truncatula TaxID=3880 RepID=A0A396GWF9_MEDTR|nr:putative transcription factor GRF family [Medicago truncatula]
MAREMTILPLMSLVLHAMTVLPLPPSFLLHVFFFSSQSYFLLFETLKHQIFFSIEPSLSFPHLRFTFSRSKMSTGNSSTGYTYGSLLYGEFETSRGMLPMCRCELPMVIYIANTRANQGRRFWKCTRPMVEVTSRMAVTEEKVKVEEEVESKEKKCNCVEAMEGIYDLKKDKWKKKMLAEKKKVAWLKWSLVASWVLFCVFYARK